MIVIASDRTVQRLWKTLNACFAGFACISFLLLGKKPSSSLVPVKRNFEARESFTRRSISVCVTPGLAALFWL